MEDKVQQGRIKPKKESTFGRMKKPFKSTYRNRKGNTKETSKLEPQGRVKEEKYVKPERKW